MYNENDLQEAFNLGYKEASNSYDEQDLQEAFETGYKDASLAGITSKLMDGARKLNPFSSGVKPAAFNQTINKAREAAKGPTVKQYTKNRMFEPKGLDPTRFDRVGPPKIQRRSDWRIKQDSAVLNELETASIKPPSLNRLDRQNIENNYASTIGPRKI